MDEIKQILYAILEAEAINAAKIDELKQEQKMMREQLILLQEQINLGVQDVDCVRESCSLYVVS